MKTLLAGLGAGLVFAAAAHAQVSGVVQQAGTLAPIPNAIVSVQNSAVRTTSAVDGSFDLPAAIGPARVIVAAAQGFLNHSVRVDAPAAGVAIVLEAVPQGGAPGYTPVAPATCGACHPDQFAQWLDTPMALAGSNTWVQDVYDGTGTSGGTGGFVYVRDSIHAAANVESECAACHQPESWIDAPFTALADLAAPTNAALHGVSCEVCHKIGRVDETRLNFPGLHPDSVEWTRPQPPTFNQVQYGVLLDVDYTNPPLMRAAYQPQLVAETCAVCHQDKNDPDEDGDFEEANGVISEPTYLEWEESPYADPNSPVFATCVDCHMPSFGASTVCIALVPPLLRDPQSIRSHAIAGTNAEFLENAALLEIQASEVEGAVEVSVSVTNDRTGHHLPTGVTVRNMILLVEAEREADAVPLSQTSGETVHALGGVGDPAAGYYAGRPGKLYAKVNHGIGGTGPVFFTEATGIAFDNRIPALATDTSTFRFARPAMAGNVRVRASLIYRRAFRALVDAKQWTQTGHGAPLEDIAPPYFGHLMEEAETTLAVPEPGPSLLFAAAVAALAARRALRAA